MTKLLEQCLKHFGTEDLYDVFKISKSAKNSEIKKAYYKLSLVVHPDKVKEEERDIATEKFQVLGKVYSILSDKDKRAIYDESGEIDEEDFVQENKDWDHYWRLLFKKISISDIEKFEKKFKGSEEEKEELKQAYLDGKGDMTYIIENVMCASTEDEDRFEEILAEMIEKKEIKALSKFTKQTDKDKAKRKRKANKEAAEAEEMKQKLGISNGSDSLEQLILSRGRQREQQMDDFFDNLATKYAQKPKKNKRK